MSSTRLVSGRQRQRHELGYGGGDVPSGAAAAGYPGAGRPTRVVDYSKGKVIERDAYARRRYTRDTLARVTVEHGAATSGAMSAPPARSKTKLPDIARRNGNGNGGMSGGAPAHSNRQSQFFNSGIALLTSHPLPRLSGT